MPQDGKTLIMKFGGAAVKTPESFAQIANIITKRALDYSKIVIVVSAMGGVTDQLIDLAHQVHPSPPRREYDMLVSVGERISISLLAMALAVVGKEAFSFTGSQSGILTTDDHSEARILDVRPHRLLPYLNEGKIAIVAGFQGVSVSKEITTLGRGGSDTTAVALGIALHAEKVEFYKDVLGIYPEDPKKKSHLEPYPYLNYEEALKITTATGGKILHPRAVTLAMHNALPLQVRSFIESEQEGTRIATVAPRSQRQFYEFPMPKASQKSDLDL